MGINHVILDRDGVINREAEEGRCISRPDDFHWIPGALEGIASMRAWGLRISVATNQSGVGRGQMTLAELEAVHVRMCSEAAAAGAKLDALFFCPHLPEANCRCRKPASGMIQAAVAVSRIPPVETLMVGDDQRDLDAARHAGVAAVLVRTGKGRRTEIKMREPAVLVFDDLGAIARALIAGTSFHGEAK
jgi:D-glycero-D-manno-heptose 1,7-bisphosphate phosphatase